MREELDRPAWRHPEPRLLEPAPPWSANLLDGHSRRGQRRPPIQDLKLEAGSRRSSADDMLRFLRRASSRPPSVRLGPSEGR